MEDTKCGDGLENDAGRLHQQDGIDTTAASVVNGCHPTSYADAVMNGSTLGNNVTDYAIDQNVSDLHYQHHRGQQTQTPQSRPELQLDHRQQIQVNFSQVDQSNLRHHENHFQHHNYHHSHGHHDSSETHPGTSIQQKPHSNPPQCFQNPDMSKDIENRIYYSDQSSNHHHFACNHYSNSSQIGGENTKESLSHNNHANIERNCKGETNDFMFESHENDGRLSIASERAMSIASERATTPMAMSTVAEDEFMNQDVLNEDTIVVNDEGEQLVQSGSVGDGNSRRLETNSTGPQTHQPNSMILPFKSNGVTDENNTGSDFSERTTPCASANPDTSQEIESTHNSFKSVLTNALPLDIHRNNNIPDADGLEENKAAEVAFSTPVAAALTRQRPKSLSKELLRSPEHTVERLSYVLGRGTLVMINFSQRNLSFGDAELIRSAIIANPQLGVLKLGYNNLGDTGTSLIASAINFGGDGFEETDKVKLGESDESKCKGADSFHRRQHHPSLSVLDLGFNNIGDRGCFSLATLAVSRNSTLSTLYLSGNAVGEQGALALADAVAGGCGLTSLHLTANRVGAPGVKGLMRSIAEFDVIVQMAQQDRENRMALEEEKKRRLAMMNAGSIDAVGNDVTNLDCGDESELDDLARLNGFNCMEELYLGGTNMGSTGCLSVSNMLLTNLSLRVLCLSDNGLNDQDLSLFSQSISRNRQLPIETLRFSFNRLTCVGVETLMNAIWESKTLREIKLDNNQIRDRGAQLAAVVLTSVDLEVLDLGFNRLTIVGVKALMKSLAENSSLNTLTLSGNVLDTNASKAVSYALAYNRTIQKLFVDHCSLSYAAQRHIAAGIVSNSNLALRVMSGFPLGAISVTLGLPAAMEHWTNEQVLKFIRVMWDRHRHENGPTLALSKESSLSLSTSGVSESSPNPGGAKSPAKTDEKVGPSDPATVVAAAMSAFTALGDTAGTLLTTEEPQRAISETSPIVSSDAVMLEKTPSGTIRVPPLDDSDDESSQADKSATPLEVSVSHVSTDSLCTANGKECPETPLDPVKKKRNMEWLRLHYRSLNGMTQLPFVHADLLQLYRYFYSPIDVEEDGSVQEGNANRTNLKSGDSGGTTPTEFFYTEKHPPNSPSLSSASSAGPHTARRQIMPGLQRKASYRSLHDVAMMPDSLNYRLRSPNFISIDNSCRRRPVSALEGCNPMQPALKRARNDKPRIDYFPRIKTKIEAFLSSSNQPKALVLLRQLKFIETMLFRDGHPYQDQVSRDNDPTELVPADAEIILIDMM
mmetsp:Transcript_9703/g.20209  ORF Transcript_9703/g.20209 Transcript_9703/m.20209 type:complete len:1276 (-) Transcript_9703:169-3996(-)